MKRTIKLALLAFLIFLVSTLVFTACNGNNTPANDNTSNSTPPSTTYTASDIYNQAVKYVGEIVIYDKSGNELALGTGFVYSSDGKIITNYHVIEGAYSARIDINGKIYTVTSVLAYDAHIDLAVLQINATGLDTATISNGSTQVGEVVYAIGSSQGLTNTLSQGIVTYANRVVDNVAHVQHDASITHGNSGGPLINEYGEIIGINTWGVSDSQNLNFAVSINELDNLVYGTPITLSELFEEQPTPDDAATQQWFLEQFDIAKSQYIGLLRASKTSKNNQINDLNSQIGSYYSAYLKECDQINERCASMGVTNSGYHKSLLDTAKANYESSIKVYTDQIAVLREDIADIDKEISNPNLGNVLSILAENCDISEQQAQDYYMEFIGHSYKAVVTSPTCTQKGYTTHTCTTCGDTYIDSYVDARGHSYNSAITSPTCTAQGYTTHTCFCGDSYVDSYVDKKDHTYTATVTNPTCTTEGYTTHSCVSCADYYIDTYVDAKGHNYTSLVTNPTCDAKGYSTHTCTCGYSYKDTFVDSHLYIDADNDIICDVCNLSYAGLYDANGTKIASWDKLITQYGMDVTKNYTLETYKTDQNSPYCILTNNVALSTGVNLIIGNVNKIGEFAFRDCTQLTNVTISNSVTTIGYDAFCCCENLKTITIPNSVKSIDSYAFNYCTSLTSITIPTGVSEIHNYAFQYCFGLRNITIPNSVSIIGFYAFSGCLNLTSIVFEGTIANWNSIQKPPNWNLYVPATEVICSDGVITLN